MSVSIKDVVSITGAPGLFLVVKTDDKAIVVESLDEKRKRQLVKGNMMVSKLTDVSIYTTDESEPLVNVLQAIQAKYPDALPVSKDSSKEEMMNFLEEVLPTFDKEKVYPSNIKKLISWYEVLKAENVDLKLEDESATEEPATEETEEEAVPVAEESTDADA